MATEKSVVITPPILPVKRLSAVMAPPKPPALPGKPGIPKASTMAVPARPSLPETATRKQEIERRKEALMGTEYSDPKSTIAMITMGFKNTLKALPILIKKYWWIALIVAGLWMFLMTFDAAAWSARNPSMRGLFYGIAPVAGFLVFLTAAYNNWVAKSIYGLVVLKGGVPLFRRIKAEGFGKVTGSFKSVGPGLKNNWAESGALSLPLFVVTIGVGIAVSNFLSGNNSYTRYLASLALALSMVKMLSDGKKTMPFMASRVIGKDVFKLFNKSSPVRNHHIFVGVTGFMTGLTAAAVLALALFFGMVSMGPVFEKMGYYIGGVVIVAGIVLYFVKARAPKQTSQAVNGGEVK